MKNNSSLSGSLISLMESLSRHEKMPEDLSGRVILINKETKDEIEIYYPSVLAYTYLNSGYKLK